MTARFANQHEIATWNNHILSNPDGGNVFQGYEFAQQKILTGWTPRFIIIDKITITVLEKYVIGLGKIWYVPKGPGIRTVRDLENLIPEFEDIATKNNVFVLKIEPELIKEQETLANLMKLGLIRARPIQPNFSTVNLDLTDTVRMILANLNQKGRHAIKRAERDGVTVASVDASDANCRIMYRLLEETASGSFTIRSFDYYRAFWQRYSRAGLGQLFFAYTDKTVIAGAYAIVFGKKSTYKDGASTRQRTTYGASHLLQWHVIKWAKSQGSHIHDLCGAPPSDQIKNTDHPHYGIGRFKTSFNKEITDYVGAYDLVINPRSYKLWTRVGEKIVTKIHSRLHKEGYY